MHSPELAFHQAGAAFFMTGFILFSAAGSAALLLGLLVLLQSAAPDLVGRAATGLRERPYVSLGVGAVAFAGFLGLAALGNTVPPARAFAVAAFGGLSLFGLAATAENLGRRIAWNAGREGSRASNLAVGWLVFFAAACVPYVGWLLVLPWGLLSGIGALFLGLGRPNPSPAAPE